MTKLNDITSNKRLVSSLTIKVFFQPNLGFCFSYAYCIIYILISLLAVISIYNFWISLKRSSETQKKILLFTLDLPKTNAL